MRSIFWGSQCRQAASRREFLRIGGLSALGLGLGDLFRLQRLKAQETNFQETRNAPRAKSCILIWLDGGPSHLETFDPKPDAPIEVRGPLQSIATSVPGVRFTECLPKTAALAHQLAIIRSMTSPLGEHNFGTHYLMTGFKPTPVLEYPMLGAVLAEVREQVGVLPANIAVPDFSVGGSKLSGAGYLSTASQPFSLGGDPAKPGFQVRDLDFARGMNLARLDRRRQFVSALNDFHEKIDGEADRREDSDLERAYQLLTSNDAKKAFKLSEETAATRERYGRKTIGQSCLLARRLVERGVPFVTVNNPGWDTHDKLYTRLKEGYAGAKIGVGLIPSLDLALSSLIEDLHDRGMLDETLVMVMGEFGRTPKLNTAGGRDHWPRVFSAVVAGGGIQGGQVVGRSDAVGESPQDRPVTPSDLAATAYTLLGVDPTHELRTRDGRPVRVTPEEATVIDELIS
ncbi:MAG: DUF1501 domain-containing protein [Planctomycetaceae bacterium]|nr:DUF1501 domain-containing protein [Planctomycetaceae bacterium]